MNLLLMVRMLRRSRPERRSSRVDAVKPLLTVCVLLSLAGCAWLGDKDNTEPPAKLGDFQETARLKKAWSHDSGKGTDHQLLKLVPAITAERVYLADRSGRVEALDKQTGRRIWKTSTRTLLSAGPGVGDELVLLGTSDGELIALRADDGAERWRTPASSEILAIPRIHAGVVIVQTVDGNLSGYNSETGHRLWVFDRTVPVLTLRGTSSPLIIDDVVLAGFASGKLYALDIQTGRQLWEASVAVPSGRSELERLVDVDADAVMRDGMLYVASFQGQLAAVNMADGALLWNRDMSAFAGLAVDDSQVYLTDEDSQVWALAKDSGQSMWKQDRLLHRSLTGPAIFGDFVVVGDYAGYVHLLSKTDGHLAGRRRVDRAGIQVTPRVDGNRLYVLGAGGKLVVYELQAQSPSVRSGADPWTDS